MKKTLVILSSVALIASIAAPAAFAKGHEDSVRVHAQSQASSTVSTSTNPCAKMAWGHLIAPGWLRKHLAPVAANCTLPNGIMQLLHRSTSTRHEANDGRDRENDRDNDNDHGQRASSTLAISAIAAVPSTTTASLSWTTSVPTRTKVYYSAVTPVDLAATSTVLAIDNSLRTSHTLFIGGLNASTTYGFVIWSQDAFGNTATSSQQSFTTLH